MAVVSNQFSSLGGENEVKRSDEEEVSFETMIAEAVEAVVNCEAGKKREDTSRQQKKTKGKGAGATQNEGAIKGDLVATMVAALQPVLVKSVKQQQ